MARAETVAEAPPDAAAGAHRVVDAARITGVVLAGGRGSRMGGVDKGLQLFRGEPLVATVARRLAPQVGTLVVSANRHVDRYAAFATQVVPDTFGKAAGPLAGIHAALATCTTDFVAVAPCDAPFVPDDLVARLAEALADDAIEIAFATTAVRRHPVFCLMRRTLLPHLVAHLEHGGRAVGGWIASRSSRAVSFADEAAFCNLNTLDELHAAARG